MKRLLPYVRPAQFVTVGYQLCLLGVTITILALLVYKPFVQFHPVGPAPIITPVTEKVIKSWEQDPARVKVGMHITDFLRFDTVKNEFILNAFIWFDYDPEEVTPKQIDAFAFTKGEIVQKSPPIVEKRGDLNRVLYAIRVQFSTILDFTRFPLDDHRIYLNLVNRRTNADDLIYEADPTNFIISKNIFVAGWRVVGHSVKSGYARVELTPKDTVLQNKTVFALDLSKGDMRQLMLILLPLLFLFYLGLFAFSIHDVNVAMALPLASISGLFAYSFVIQIVAPMVGYMMMSDYFFFFFLISAFIIFLIKALAAVPETHLSRHRLKTIEGIAALALQFSLIVVWYLLLDVRGI